MRGAFVVLISLASACSDSPGGAAGDAGGDAAVTDRVLFHSDWSTARGSTEDALRDTSKAKPWVQWAARDNEVVDAAGLGFPASMANVHRTVANGRSVVLAFGADPAYFGANAVQYFAPPAVGERISYRMYLRCDVPDVYGGGAAGDLSWHPWQDTYGSGNWVGNIETAQNGRWNWRFSVAGQDASVWPHDRWGRNVELVLGNVYRIEWQVHRTGDATWQLHMRVFDTDDTTLLFDDETIRNAQPSNTTSLAAYNAADNHFVLPDLAALPGLTVGVNGFQDDEIDDFPFTFSYTGGVAICAGDWCGPYRDGI